MSYPLEFLNLELLRLLPADSLVTIGSAIIGNDRKINIKFIHPVKRSTHAIVGRVLISIALRAKCLAVLFVQPLRASIDVEH
jgi:hypothetical protein